MLPCLLGLVLGVAPAVGCGRIDYDPLPLDGDLDGSVAGMDADVEPGRDGATEADGGTGRDGATEADGGTGVDGGAADGGDGGGTDAGTGVVIVGESPDADFTSVTDDTVLNAEFPTLNYGAAEAMNLREDFISIFVGLVRFDLSELPTGTVTGAELHVTTTTTVFDSGRVDVYRMLERWQAGDQNGAAGVANAGERLPGVVWTTVVAGPGSRASTAMGTFSPTSASTEYVVALDPEVVQGWLDAPESNHGMALVATDHRVGATVQLATSEAPSGQPHLVVRY